MKKIFFILIFAFVYLDILGCNCNVPVEKLTDDIINEYNLVFKGYVVDIDTVDGKFLKEITFGVTSFYKGNMVKDTVKVFTMLEEGVCGLPVKLNEEWLIFAFRVDTVFETHLCTRSSNMSSMGYYMGRVDLLNSDMSFLEEYIRRKSKEVLPSKPTELHKKDSDVLE